MTNTLWEQAKSFLKAFYQESGKEAAQLNMRLQAIKEEIEQSGTYSHTFEEIEYGAKVAWRNSNRCIGRLFWQTLQVIDERKAETEQEVFAALERHIQIAYNGGKIKPVVTLFRPSGIRIWNHQLLRYAGYKQAGDPHSRAFTSICESLGWEGEGGDFDFLPWVVQLSNKPPVWKKVPEQSRVEVDITHPGLSWFKNLDLKWYAIPVISDMKLEIGGINYQAAPFNGWYMGTEIGARNFADEDRYNLLPKIAEKMNLPVKNASLLWKDRALIELNTAVLHSFKEAGATIVDHHTAAKQHQIFEQNETAAGRPVTGDWTWLIPPLSPASVHVFHRSYDNTIQSPNFFYQPVPYK